MSASGPNELSGHVDYFLACCLSVESGAMSLYITITIRMV